MRFQKHTTNQIIKSSFLNISKSLVKQNIQAEDFPRNGMTGFEIVQGWIKDKIQVARFFFTSEMIVNLPAAKLLQKYVRISARINPDLVLDLPEEVLPGDWNSRPIAPSTRVIGDQWIKEQHSAILRVPSIVVPEEYNYLLNPAHPDFVKIRIGKPIVNYFDPRLVKP